MTGFGRGTAQAGPFIATVELRSVNNRFCEVSVRLPRKLSAFEVDVQTRIKQTFDRGRINVQIQVEERETAALPVAVNPQVARGYARLLEDLKAAAGLDEPVSLTHLLTFPEIFTTFEEPPDVIGEQWQAASEALEAAVADMDVMRRQEGEALAADLEARLDTIETQLQAVEARAPERVEEARRRLQERLQEYIDDERLDPERLEFEIAMLSDRLDVTEECVRLRSHLTLFRDALRTGDAVGRKLNFITQEINREVNTIASKANDADLTHRSVTMKEELEKIREQVQNIE